MKKLLLILSLIVFSGIVGAVTIGETGQSEVRGVVIQTPTPEVNTSFYNVSSADYWDALDNPSDIYISELIDDDTYVEVAGDTMTGDLNIDGHGLISSFVNTSDGGKLGNIIFSGGEYPTISINTTDGEDTSYFSMSGGGLSGGFTDSSRGAGFYLEGNEQPFYAGDIVLFAGDVATGDIQFWTANSQTRAVMDYDGEMTFYKNLYSLGNLGVGTTSPDRAVEILNTSTQLRLTHTDNNKYTDLQTTADGYFNITPSGGRTYINGANYLTSFITAPTYPLLNLYSGASQVGTIGSGNIAGGSATDLGLVVGSGRRIYLAAGSTTPAMTIYNNRVGIGTTTPIFPLHFYSSQTGLALFDGTTSPTFAFAVAGTGFGGFGSYLGVKGSGSATDVAFSAKDNLRFVTGTSPNLYTRASLTGSNGYFGINTEAPDRRFEVVDTTTQFRLSYINDTNYTDFFTNSAGDLVITPSGGKVGIGTTPTYPLTVSGNVSGISIWSDGNISASGYITRTNVYDTSKGSALNKIKDASAYLDKKGDINHSSFDGSYVKYDVEKCVSTKLINITTYKNVSYWCEEYVSNEICYEVIPETQTYEVCDYENVTEEGVDLGKEVALLKQAIYELKVENEDLKARITALEAICS